MSLKVQLGLVVSSHWLQYTRRDHIHIAHTMQMYYAFGGLPCSDTLMTRVNAGLAMPVCACQLVGCGHLIGDAVDAVVYTLAWHARIHRSPAPRTVAWSPSKRGTCMLVSESGLVV